MTAGVVLDVGRTPLSAGLLPRPVATRLLLSVPLKVPAAIEPQGQPARVPTTGRALALSTLRLAWVLPRSRRVVRAPIAHRPVVRPHKRLAEQPMDCLVAHEVDRLVRNPLADVTIPARSAPSYPGVDVARPSVRGKHRPCW